MGGVYAISEKGEVVEIGWREGCGGWEKLLEMKG